ncbi:hypothetical protein ANN_26086 [Periplaneta americana]|uniref:Uncharacterized protein n=1 Tax=Periplaneta americana TaxID=6978 RepID=A0ABQ8S5C1_PERAM|nr:hypothetical protein ANN_26086 [Periplaneta americana]
MIAIIHQNKCEMISSAYPGKFTVRMVQPQYCFQFKDWWPKYYKKCCNSLETSGPETPRDTRQFFTITNSWSFSMIGAGRTLWYYKRKGTIIASQFISGFQQTFLLGLRGSTVMLPIQNAYPNGKVEIKEEKIEDIKKTMRYINDENKEWYEEIIGWN